MHGGICRTGLFANVDAQVKPMAKGKFQVRFIFTEQTWPEMETFKVASSGDKPQGPIKALADVACIIARYHQVMGH